MKILAIDTSGRLASCALYENGALAAACTKDSQMDHSRTILPLCEEMVHSRGLRFRDIDVFAAAVGPGSFTGIRIGVSAVKGFALAGNKPACGVSTLEATAALVPDEGLICAILRARENEYFYGFFRNVGGTLYRICDDNCLTGPELRSILYGARWLLCGDGAADFLQNNPCDPDKVRDTGVHQHASGVAKCAWELAQCDALCDGNDVVPVYLKKTQAERMREEKTK